jgi:hypothetical protein
MVAHVSHRQASFPEWLEGEWACTQSFAGYELPSKELVPRAELFAETNVPGFLKCSIAYGTSGTTPRDSRPMALFRVPCCALRHSHAAH